MIRNFLNSLVGNELPKKTGEVLLYRDIPLHSKSCLFHEAYPQVMGIPLEPRPLDFFCQRYADNLHELFNGLAISKEQIDYLLMPIMTQFIKLVNILPASEHHHHSGVCGLFVHSLQCATIAVAEAEKRVLGRNVTLRQRYHDKPRWLVGAAVLGLVHDVGKIFDIEVVSENGEKWNPFSVPMWSWACQTNAKKVFVVWKKERLHKQHELRSVRTAYNRLMTDSLIGYLTEFSGDLILGAIDDAIVFGTGPFGEIIRQAEAASIRQDGQDRKRLGFTFTNTSSPLVLPILNAIKELIDTGLWSINGENSQVYVTTQGFFVRLNDALALDVHQTASKHQAPYIPSSADGLIRVLQEQNVIELFQRKDQQFSAVWSIAVGKENTKKYACVKLRNPSMFLSDCRMPATIDVLIQDNAITENEIERDEPIKPKRELQFLAPQADFLQETKLKNEGDSTQVTEAECDEEFSEPSEPQEAEKFVRRLLATLRQQMLSEKGFLLDSSLVCGEGFCSCNSLIVESILKKRKIGKKTQEMLIRLSSQRFNLYFNPIEHSFTLKGNDNEESKPNSELSIRL